MSKTHYEIEFRNDNRVWQQLRDESGKVVEFTTPKEAEKQKEAMPGMDVEIIKVFYKRTKWRKVEYECRRNSHYY